MANKLIHSRIQHKHDVEAHWRLATGFIPLAGELIIYDEDENFSYKRFKLGDGETTITELDFYTVDADNVLYAEDTVKTALDAILTDISALDAFKVQTEGIIDTYIINIDYNRTLKFDVTELVIGGGGATSPILGVGMLGYMVLA